MFSIIYANYILACLSYGEKKGQNYPNGLQQTCFAKELLSGVFWHSDFCCQAVLGYFSIFCRACLLIYQKIV